MLEIGYKELCKFFSPSWIFNEWIFQLQCTRCTYRLSKIKTLKLISAFLSSGVTVLLRGFYLRINWPSSLIVSSQGWAFHKDRRHGTMPLSMSVAVSTSLNGFRNLVQHFYDSPTWIKSKISSQWQWYVKTVCKQTKESKFKYLSTN